MAEPSSKTTSAHSRNGQSRAVQVTVWYKKRGIRKTKPPKVNNHDPDRIHAGVACQGCGVCPVVGLRFRVSNFWFYWEREGTNNDEAFEDYSLCGKCMANFGTIKERIRADLGGVRSVSFEAVPRAIQAAVWTKRGGVWKMISVEVSDFDQDFIHMGTYCRGCRQFPVVGLRFCPRRCPLEFENYNLCGRCVADNSTIKGLDDFSDFDSVKFEAVDDDGADCFYHWDGTSPGFFEREKSAWRKAVQEWKCRGEECRHALVACMQLCLQRWAHTDVYPFAELSRVPSMIQRDIIQAAFGLNAPIVAGVYANRCSKTLIISPGLTTARLDYWGDPDTIYDWGGDSSLKSKIMDFESNFAGERPYMERLKAWLNSSQPFETFVTPGQWLGSFHDVHCTGQRIEFNQNSRPQVGTAVSSPDGLFYGISEWVVDVEVPRSDEDHNLEGTNRYFLIKRFP